MSSRHTIWLIARRELRERFRSRAFRVGTAVQIFIVLIVVVIGALSGGDDGPTTYKLGATGAQSAPLAAAAKARAPAFSARVDVRSYPDPAAATQAVRDSDVDAALVGARLIVRGGSDTPLAGIVEAGAQRLESLEALSKAGVPPAAATRALSPPPLPVAQVSASGDENGVVIAFIGTLLLYIAILSYGLVVATGVVEEKSSRVVELILAAVRPRQLLAGKILGIGALGLATLAVIGTVGLAGAALSGQIELPSTTVGTILLIILWFALGYALYACAFATAGALVSRQEDVQSVTAPIMIVIIGGYVASIQVSSHPHSTLAEILTFVPPIAPMVVPARAAQDALPTWELLVSIALMLIAIAGVIALAAFVYERAVLRIGAPVKLRQVLSRRTTKSFA